MTSRRFLLAMGLFMAIPSPGRSDDQDAGLFPPAHELFTPLLADPRELQYALRTVAPVGRRSLAEAAMGDYLGIYRWDLPSGALFQISVGGGVFGRFDLANRSNALQVADYYGNMPFDYRRGKWSYRFMVYHTSSHLGDDYIKAHGSVTEKHTWDNLRWLASYNKNDRLRAYGGYTYVFRTLPRHAGRNAFQGGFEATTRRWAQDHLQLYWANDLQFWQRVQWNPMFNSQLGVTISKDAQSHRGLALFVEYTAGRQPQGQFYLNSETRWNLGIRFDLS